MFRLFGTEVFYHSYRGGIESARLNSPKSHPDTVIKELNTERFSDSDYKRPTVHPGADEYERKYKELP